MWTLRLPKAKFSKCPRGRHSQESRLGTGEAFRDLLWSLLVLLATAPLARPPATPRSLCRESQLCGFSTVGQRQPFRGPLGLIVGRQAGTGGPGPGSSPLAHKAITFYFL